VAKQRGLADAGLTHQHHQPTRTSRGGFESLVQLA
jgi:hypothetical protein